MSRRCRDLAHSSAHGPVSDGAIAIWRGSGRTSHFGFSDSLAFGGDRSDTNKRGSKTGKAAWGRTKRSGNMSGNAQADQAVLFNLFQSSHHNG